MFKKFSEWTEAEQDAVRQYYAGGQTGNLAEMLPGRTYWAVRSKAYKLGIYRKPAHSRVEGACRECGAVGLLKGGRIAPGVCDTCYKRIYARVNSQGQARTDLWSNEEKETLRRLWKEKTPDEIVSAIGRTWNACKHQAHLMDITTPQDAAHDVEPVRSAAYWHEWAQQQQAKKPEMAREIFELIVTERRILRYMDAAKGAHHHEL